MEVESLPCDTDEPGYQKNQLWKWSFKFYHA